MRKFYSSLVCEILSRYLEYKLIDRKDLEEYSEVYWNFGENESMTVSVDGLEHIHPQFEKISGDYEVTQRFVCELSDIDVRGPSTIVLTNKNQVVLETSKNTRYILQKQCEDMLGEFSERKMLRTLFSADSKSVRQIEIGFPLLSYWGNYYTWLLEYLPQLRGLEYYNQKTGCRPQIVIQQNPPSWMIESLEVIGYDDESWIAYDGEGLDINKTVITTHRHRWSEDYNPSVEDCRWVRERALTAINKSSNSNQKSLRIFISREDANERQVLNRDELLDELRPYGFESYVLSDLSFEYQVELFAEAEYVVAPHGAGLANIVFANDLHVLELMPAEDVRRGFFALTSELGHTYDYIICEQEDQNMRIDTDRVLSKIESIDEPG